MNDQKGSALLIVLMILALMAALAAEMTISFQVQLQRSRRINDSLQGNYALLYAEADSMASFQETPGNILTHSVTPGDSTEVSWQINDLHHCYNLNALENMPEDPLATPPYEVSIFTHYWRSSPLKNIRRKSSHNPLQTISMITIQRALKARKTNTTSMASLDILLQVRCSFYPQKRAISKE